jgi:ribosomal protein L11 methyltransferase
MDIITLECDPGEKDKVIGELYEAGTLGVIEEDLPEGRCRLQAFFEAGTGGAGLLSQFSGCGATLRRQEAREEARDWAGEARAQWQPLAVGERFFLAPAWRDDPAPAGRLRLEMPPGTAPGTGLHAATQLALEALELCVRPGDCVFDLGTGSGILAASARLLGAGTVIACDVEWDAAAAAHQYCGPAAAVFAGSARSLRDASVDVVVANISAAALTALAGEIVRILKPGGKALLTGFTGEALPRLSGPLGVTTTLTQGEWVCLIAGLEG